MKIKITEIKWKEADENQNKNRMEIKGKIEMEIT